MLGKMIKHEFKATARLYVPLYLAVIVLTPLLSLLLRFSLSIGENSLAGKIFSGVSAIGFALMLGALCISAFVFIIVRFYKTVATSEAYLTFCLPVKPSQILLSKALIGVMWQVLSVVLLIGSILELLLIQGSQLPHKISEVFSQISPLITAEYGSLFPFFLHFGFILIVTAASSTLIMFLAICLGQLFNEHRVIASVGMYAIVYTVTQIISMLAFLPYMIEGESSFMVAQASAVNLEVDSIPTFGFMMVLTVTQLIFAIASYIGCSIILKKKTNVR